MAAALGYVYSITKDPIEKAKLEKVNSAIKQVVPVFDNDPGLEKIVIEEGRLILFPAKNGDELVGVAVQTYTEKGFSGYFSIMVGFLPDGTINKTMVLDQKETPGLGSKMSEPAFSNQFNTKNPDSFKLSVKKDGGDVDAITASTITSRAYCDAITRAYNEFKKQFVK